MKRHKRWGILFIVKLVLIAMIALDYGFIWYEFYLDQLYFKTFYFVGNFVVVFLAAFVYAIFARLYGVFMLTISKVQNIIYSNAVSLFVTSIIMYTVSILLERRLPNALPIILFFVIGVLIGVFWANVAIVITNRITPLTNILLIYDNDEARINGKAIIEKYPARYSLIGEKHVSDNIEDTIRAIKKYRPKSVMLCGIHSSPRNTILKYCVEKDITVYIRPNIGDFLVNSATNVQMANLPVMICRGHQQTSLYLFLKRGIDIVLAILGLIVFSPFMIITAIAIKLYDHGPVIYKQVRLTRDRKEFYVYKFRSMRVDAEKDGQARLASKNDDRITPVGKIIRAVRIDEMPQIFCILSGNMSIVGPRPERPEIAKEYEKKMPEFALRLKVKAGLTGYAQVYGKYNTEPYDKLQMDLMYIANQSLVEDFKIIFATIKILFMPESTEGVADQNPVKAEKANDGEV